MRGGCMWGRGMYVREGDVEEKVGRRKRSSYLSSGGQDPRGALGPR